MLLRRADDRRGAQHHNTRLDAATIAFQLDHGEARVLIVDREFSKSVKEAPYWRGRWSSTMTIPSLPAPESGSASSTTRNSCRRAIRVAWQMPPDEWDAIASQLYLGHDRDPPKEWSSSPWRLSARDRQRADRQHEQALRLSVDAADVPLQRLVLPRTISVVAGTHVCLRQVRPPCTTPSQRTGSRMRGAPIVMATCSTRRQRREAAAARGRVLHGRRAAAGSGAGGHERGRLQRHPCHGLTETTGRRPPTNGTPHGMRSPSEQAARKARQGVRYVPLEALDVLDPDTMAPVPRRREQQRGDVPAMSVMKGYLKNKPATAKAFAGGWFHSGDLGVMHPDGYIQLKDRSMTSSSPAANISSIEVEDAHSTSTRRCRLSQWWPSPTRNGARRPALSSSSSRGGRRRPRSSSPGVAATRRLQVSAPRGIRGAAEDIDREDSEIQAA